jgi:hypothetical protein
MREGENGEIKMEGFGRIGRVGPKHIREDRIL